MLSDTQILLLNNLIYLDPFTHAGDYTGTCGMTVGEVIELIDPERYASDFNTPDEIRDILEMAEGDSEISSLVLTFQNYEPETGAAMACFVDQNGEAYAVFSGTGGNEWRDDCTAGLEADSVQQVKAYEWIESLPYEGIHVSGHSKGGNKAMYVAVRSDKVIDCLAFDGEGFSNEFLEKYADRIKERVSRIRLIANYRDYVNVLLKRIPGIEIKYVDNKTGGISNAAEYHCPNALFKYEDGKIVYSIGNLTDEQDPLMQMLHELSEFLIDHASPAEAILALSVLGELLEQYLGHGPAEVREDILEMFGVEGAEIILRYMSLYLRRVMITDPLKYFRYKAAFENLAGDALGFGFWQQIIGFVFFEPVSGSLIFDNIVNGTVTHLYKTYELIFGGNVRGRDFSREIMEIMLNAARETEDEEWWQVTRWDCWYRVENTFGLLQWDRYTGRIDEYYRKLIDVNDASLSEIERIFERVYETDRTFGSYVSMLNNELSERVESVLSSLSASIVVSA